VVLLVSSGIRADAGIEKRKQADFARYLSSPNNASAIPAARNEPPPKIEKLESIAMEKVAKTIVVALK
jgi:hypothetical protein